VKLLKNSDFIHEYLLPTEFLDFDHSLARDFADTNMFGAKSETEKAVKLYYAVRDGFQNHRYLLDLRQEDLKASNLLTRNRDNCVVKAILLGARARAVGVPSRLSFFIVRNHLATEKLEKKLKKIISFFTARLKYF
jgi:transglutaminase-like putative cysteine protease